LHPISLLYFVTFKPILTTVQPTGTTNELLYGLMVNAIPGHKNPVGASVYGSIAGDAWYRAQYLLQDQKLGHYMHIPPRTVFFSQVFGSLIGVPINYGVVRWVLNTKGDYISGAKIDPHHQWTGQGLAENLTMATQYVLIVYHLPLYIFKYKLIINRGPGVSSPSPYTALFHTASSSAP
jgi:hypothetical protein